MLSNTQDTSVVHLGKMRTHCTIMNDLFEVLKKVAITNCTVLISGESGTGKEVAASTIHELSKRKDEKFVAINCSAIPEQLLESELFGHKKGSFTGAVENRKGLFEEANGGTLFLDEIGDLSFSLQAKLLRVIQEREITPVGENYPRTIDVRIIAASHKDLSQLSVEGQFRSDLFYRLAVVPIKMPALRERKDDILLLARQFIHKHCSNNHIACKSLTARAEQKLIQQNWNGNIRELENNIERAVALSDQNFIDENEIMGDQKTSSHQKHISALESQFNKLGTLQELEKAYILFVLEHTDQQKDQASKILGINRKTLYRRQSFYKGETVSSTVY
jgi:two-component system response regulator HydG